MAAKGIVPGLKPADLVTIIVVLAEGADAVAETARQTLAKLPPPVLNGALGAISIRWSSIGWSPVYFGRRSGHGASPRDAAHAARDDRERRHALQRGTWPSSSRRTSSACSSTRRSSRACT